MRVVVLEKPCRLRASRILFAAALLGAAVSAHPTAAGTPELVRAMLSNAPVAADFRCSYTRTRIDGDNIRSERYHAGEADSPWGLIGVNGREPTQAELGRYARGADDRDRRHPLALDLRDMVDPEHWRLRSETQTEAVYEFRLQPNEDLDERLVDKVLGTLVVDKVRRQPIRITIVNTEPAFVAPFVRVARYFQEMVFRWDETLGTAVLAQTETRYSGRALGLKPLDKHKLVRYSDYECRPHDGPDEVVADASD